MISDGVQEEKRTIIIGREANLVLTLVLYLSSLNLLISYTHLVVVHHVLSI